MKKRLVAPQTLTVDYQTLLAYNVPRFIKHIKERGGVSEEEFQWLRCESEDPDYPEGIFMRADEYLLYPKNEEYLEKGLFVFILTIAIMSFFPGGIKIFGLHFDAQLESFVVLE